MTKKIKAKKRFIKKAVLEAECPYCGHKLIGTSKEQMAYNFKLHQMSKHPDKENVVVA